MGEGPKLPGVGGYARKAKYFHMGNFRLNFDVDEANENRKKKKEICGNNQKISLKPYSQRTIYTIPSSISRSKIIAMRISIPSRAHAK